MPLKSARTTDWDRFSLSADLLDEFDFVCIGPCAGFTSFPPWNGAAEEPPSGGSAGSAIAGERPLAAPAGASASQRNLLKRPAGAVPQCSMSLDCTLARASGPPWHRSLSGFVLPPRSGSRDLRSLASVGEFRPARIAGQSNLCRSLSCLELGFGIGFGFPKPSEPATLQFHPGYRFPDSSSC